MTRGFLPNKDDALLAWSLNFKTIISAGPVPLGLTAAQATAYSALHSSFAAAMEACAPGMKSKSLVAAKNDARDLLKTSARLLASIIQGQAAVTDAQKLELGLTVRSAPTPIPPPADAPALDIVWVKGRVVRIRLHDAANPGRRGKPANVKGAAVFSFIGEEPPTDMRQYHFEGNTTETIISITFPPDTAAGAKVWILAMWFNERTKSGPPCEPVGTNLQLGIAAV